MHGDCGGSLLPTVVVGNSAGGLAYVNEHGSVQVVRRVAHQGPVHSATAILHDGEPLVISTGGDQLARLWNQRLEPAGEPRRGHRGSVLCCAAAVTLHGTVLVTGSSDRTVGIWNVTTQGHTLVAGHTHGVRAVAVAGNLVASCGGADATVRLWDLTGASVAPVLTGHTSDTLWVDIGRLDNTEVVVSGSADGTCRVWSTSGEVLQVIDVHPDGLAWLTLAEIAGAGAILTAATDHRVRIHDGSGRLLRGPMAAHPGWVSQLRQCGDGFVTACQRDRTIRRWTLNGQLIDTIPIAV